MLAFGKLSCHVSTKRVSVDERFTFCGWPYSSSSLLNQRWFFVLEHPCLFNRSTKSTVLKLGKRAFLIIGPTKIFCRWPLVFSENSPNNDRLTELQKMNVSPTICVAWVLTLKWSSFCETNMMSLRLILVICNSSQNGTYRCPQTRLNA